MINSSKLVYSIYQLTKSETKSLTEVPIRLISIHSLQLNHPKSSRYLDIDDSNHRRIFDSKLNFQRSSFRVFHKINLPFSPYNQKATYGSYYSSKLNLLNFKREFSQKIDCELNDADKESDKKFKEKLNNRKNLSKNHSQKSKIEMNNVTPNYYGEAIATLNSLISNQEEINNRISNKTILAAKVKRTASQLDYLGVNQDDLRKMNIIHITGTKGKGSTCAFIESILRKKGFKTGLFTSPHLTSVRERIQLDGKLIDNQLFANNLFHVYDRLKFYDETVNNSNDCLDKNEMPFYFNFLTLMALYTFKQQKCNATILEVGIGGEFDCTNIVDQPIVVGISSLGLDHVRILGNTLEEIAWHKSGIFKHKVPAFTSDNQKIEALSVLLERAKERDCTLKICPPLDEYHIEENRN